MKIHIKELKSILKFYLFYSELIFLEKILKYYKIIRFYEWMTSCDNCRRFEFMNDKNDFKVSVLINEVWVKLKKSFF
jgi:hypothetical protein